MIKNARTIHIILAVSVASLCLNYRLAMLYNGLPLSRENDSSMKVNLVSSTFVGVNTTLESPFLDQLPAYRLIQEYKSKHSKEALLRGNNNDRKYAIVYYSCPQQAGNRLHHFMNAVIWSIVTNRTILYEYYDYQACTERFLQESPTVVTHCQGEPPYPCSLTNNQSECDKIMQIADWVPSYRDYRDKVPMYKHLHFWSTRLPRSSPYEMRVCPWNDTYITTVQGVKNWNDDADNTVVIFPYSVTNDLPFDNVNKEENNALEAMNFTVEQKSTIKQLYSIGGLEVYGLVFDQFFLLVHSSFASDLAAMHNRNVRSNSHRTQRPFTAGIHIRHNTNSTTRQEDTVAQQLDCLTKVMEHYQVNKTQPCRVYIMSDRQRTIAKLEEQIPKTFTNCNVSKVLEHPYQSGLETEHGPWAGLGFFQDIVHLSSHVRDAMIFPQRGSCTSSWLVTELVAYQRVVSYYSQQNRSGVLPLTDLPICYMPRKFKPV